MLDNISMDPLVLLLHLPAMIGQHLPDAIVCYYYYYYYYNWETRRKSHSVTTFRSEWLSIMSIVNLKIQSFVSSNCSFYC